MSDVELLRDYAEHGQEAAFREIVVRHTDAVYSAALRQVISHDLARDVAQRVFTDLARKASSLSRTLDAKASLLGWLYRSTRFAALNQLREDRRRQAREREAMQYFSPDSDPASAPEWERIGPVLDEAMAELSHDDSEALLLRFFQSRDFRAIGQSLGVSDDAAQKRVSRALEKLRAHLTRRGVTTSAAALSIAFSAHAVQGAPDGLAAVLSNTALAGATLGTTATITAAKTITMTTLQKAIIAGTLAVAVGTGVYEAHVASAAQSQLQKLQQQQALVAQQIQQLTRERDLAASNLATLQSDQERVRRDTDELPKLRGELTRLRALAQQSGVTQGKAAAGSEDSFTQSVLALTRRAGELNQHLQRMPDKKIPELAFLNESDWLSVAKDASFQSEGDVRQALSNLRNVAKGKFGTYATRALDKFLAANNGQLPTDLPQLKPYFEVPVEDAVLQRYQVQVLQGDDGSDPRDNWVLSEKAPADKDYEMPLQVRGWGSHGG